MIDVASLVAIDVHVHVEVSASGHHSLPDALREGADAYFAAGHRMPTVQEIAAYYRERHMAAVVFTVDAEAATSHAAISNEEIAAAAAEHPDVLIPFASIDPAKGPAGAREARRLAEAFAVRGFKFHPNLQGFFPNDRSAYPLYEAIQALGLPAIFHTGQTGIGARVRGGGGVRLKYSNPLYLDDVAVDFPDLSIVLAHPSFPWQDEALGCDTQTERVHRPLRLVTEVFPTATRPVRQHLVAGQGPVRFGLSAADTGSVARGLRNARHQTRGQAADSQAQRDAPPRPGLTA